MAQEKKRPGKRDYLKDYYTDAAGKVIYTGALYRYAGEQPYKTMLVRLWVLGAAAALAMAAVGLVPAAGIMNTFYVILPYLVGAMSGVSILFALFTISRGGDPMQARPYKQGVQALPGRTALMQVFAAVTAVGEAAFLLLNGADDSIGWDIIVLVLCAAAFLAGGLLRKTFFSINWVESRK